MSYSQIHAAKCGFDDRPSAKWHTGEGNISYGISVNFIVEVEEDTKASVSKDGRCRFKENVIVRKTSFSCHESLQCQVLLDISSVYAGC